MVFQNPLLSFISILISNLLFWVGLACFLVDDEDEICALCLPISFAVFAFCTLPSLFLNFNYFPTSHVIAVFFLVFFILFSKSQPKIITNYTSPYSIKIIL